MKRVVIRGKEYMEEKHVLVKVEILLCCVFYTLSPYTGTSPVILSIEAE